MSLLMVLALLIILGIVAAATTSRDSTFEIRLTVLRIPPNNCNAFTVSVSFPWSPYYKGVWLRAINHIFIISVRKVT